MWPKTALTYRINNYTPDLDRNIVRSEIQQAFQLWSDVSPLTFREVTTSSGKVEIDIGFARGDHGDGSAFDGPGKTLAHAFFPQFGGATHFDEDETWTSRTNSGVNLLQVAIHEFGHALGLGHSDVNGSIMAPFYRAYDPNVKLHSDDIDGITYIYGSKTTRRPLRTTPRTTPGSSLRSTAQPAPPPAICNDPQVDAIFSINGDVFVFKGSQYFRLNWNGIRDGYPRAIKDDWPGLPDEIDTAVYKNSGSGSILVFKDDKIWSYSVTRQLQQYTFQLRSGYPKQTTDEIRGLPSNLDAAFVWSGNSRMYFIKGQSYYGVTQSNGSTRVAPSYPRGLATWKGLPAKIDSAFEFSNGRTYFFSGSKFYRFNDVAFKVDVGYPLDIGRVWYGCPRQTSPGTAEVKDMETEVEDGQKQFMAVTVTGGTGARCQSSFAVIASLLAVLVSTLI